MLRIHYLVVLLLLVAAAPAWPAELILPQNRTAFYSRESIEFAIAGLKKGERTTLELAPRTKGLRALSYPIQGNGTTSLHVLPGGVLAPGEYNLKLDGKPAGKLTVASGVNRSSMYLSQTVSDPKKSGGNFLVGNAFGYGLFDPKGQPLTKIRGRRSGGMQVFDNAISKDMPTLVYMYWTGYVTHKPFGSEKSWAAKDMLEATRLLSFHTAQRLRRYAPNILMVGTLDEPGLSWGKTPAGGMASGFPNWDEQEWYARRGWKYTQDPASRPDDDWMKYMTVRCGILKEMNAQAKKDLKSIWPGLVFSTDLYAPHAVMDGTDPLNQQINDVPSSHVFLDWGCGKLGALSGVYLEKADDPTRKLAHAMNGQLFAPAVPQPNQSDAYRVMLNALLAAGLHSNWWLNPTGMKAEDLARINEPGLRMGPLFRVFAPKGHDVAVLWSFTEICMREKDVTAREAKKKTGEQIKLMIASLPDVPGAKDKLVDVNAYSIGGNYKEQVLNAHQSLARAGYPAHILHERVLAEKLKNYRTLVVVGQTFSLPADVTRTIDDWVARGGTVVVDETTTVKFPRAVVTKANFRDPSFRWNAYFARAERKDHPFKSNREASYYLTNYFMDDMARKAVPAMKEAMKKTRSQPSIETDSVHLAAEKHTAGDAALYMVLNAHEKLPDIVPDRRYPLYNYAEHEATFTLKGIKPGSAVWCIEGPDWKKVREVKDYTLAQKATFAPGEMKLFLVLPSRPALNVKVARSQQGLQVSVTASAKNGGRRAVPVPVRIRVLDSDGSERYGVYRATPANGVLVENFAVGENLEKGPGRVVVDSPLGAVANIDVKAGNPPGGGLREVKEPVRIFDEKAIRDLLGKKPTIVIACADVHKAHAEKLAAGLAKAGVKASVKKDTDAIRKVAYPRVWNPFAKVYRVAGPEKPPKDIKVEITLKTDADGNFTARTADGKDVSTEWKQPKALVTIAGAGYVDFGGDRERCYEPGVKLYINERRQVTAINARIEEQKTTPEFRKKWAKPWSRLRTHVGAYQLPPQLPEAYTTDTHLVLLGDSESSPAIAALQASEILSQTVDAKYPGPGKALVQYAWSPFAVEKDVIFIGASDAEGLTAGIEQVLRLAAKE